MSKTTKDRPIEIVDAEITETRIKDILDAKHVTQEELSRRVNASYRHINRIALGESDPSLLLALKICTVLDVDLPDVFDVKITQRRRLRKRVAAKRKRAAVRPAA